MKVLSLLEPLVATSDAGSSGAAVSLAVAASEERNANTQVCSDGCVMHACILTDDPSSLPCTRRPRQHLMQHSQWQMLHRFRQEQRKARRKPQKTWQQRRPQQRQLQ
jgi:hypothetical protein